MTKKIMIPIVWWGDFPIVTGETFVLWSEEEFERFREIGFRLGVRALGDCFFFSENLKQVEDIAEVKKQVKAVMIKYAHCEAQDTRSKPENMLLIINQDASIFESEEGAETVQYYWFKDGTEEKREEAMKELADIDGLNKMPLCLKFGGQEHFDITWGIHTGRFKELVFDRQPEEAKNPREIDLSKWNPGDQH